MSPASKFRNNLTLSAALLLAFSAQAMAQQAGSDDRPQVAYPASAAEPATSAASTQKAVKRKVAIAKPQRKSAESDAPAKEKAEDLKFVAPLPGEVVVSDRDFNQFVFPSPIAQLIFPPGAPIEGKPVYMAGNTQVLVKVQRGEDKPIQMVVELESARVAKLYLKPRPINGITYRHEGARDAGAPAAVRQSAAGEGPAAPHAEDIELLKRAVAGQIPPEFETVALPRPTRFDKFTVVPLAGWSNGTRRILNFSLVAVPGKTAVVASPQFYRQGITAVMLTGDHVDESTNPQLFVVEEVAQDE